MSSAYNILVRGLTHTFDLGRLHLTALAAVNLEVEEGSFVSVIGPSGGGKTTLLKAIGGLLEPTSGKVLVAGVSSMEARRRKAIGFVFQDQALLPWRTVIENIRLPLQVNVREAPNGHEEPERLLDVVGLAPFREYYPHQLSGGMRQRVALARALVLDPAVLLMDEPLGALDEMTRTAMRYEVLRLWDSSRKTVLFVTHSIPEAVLLSDRVVVMSSQPGHVLREISIDLPRPRDEEIERTGRFLDYAKEIKEALSLGAFGGALPLEARAGS